MQRNSSNKNINNCLLVILSIRLFILVYFAKTDFSNLINAKISKNCKSNAININGENETMELISVLKIIAIIKNAKISDNEVKIKSNINRIKDLTVLILIINLKDINRKTQASKVLAKGNNPLTKEQNIMLIKVIKVV